jgi:hypothetical protein
VWGVLAVIKYTYLPPTDPNFIQDIEDKCVLLKISTSFVDQPFQEHQMMEKQHMNQNPYIPSLCTEPGVVLDNMTRGDDVAKRSGPTDQWLAPLQGLAPMKLRFQRVSC